MRGVAGTRGMEVSHTRRSVKVDATATTLKWVVSAGYSVCQIAGGLLLHPYQTMQSLVQDKVFIWMTLLPTGVLALVTMLWRYGIVPLVQLVFSCQATAFVGCRFIPLASNWLTFFLSLLAGDVVIFVGSFFSSV